MKAGKLSVQKVNMTKETMIEQAAGLIKDATTSPKKVLTYFLFGFGMLIITVLGVASYVVYRESPSIIKRLGEDRFIAKLDQSHFNSSINHLIRRSGAISATIWAIVLAGNTRKPIYSVHNVNGEKYRQAYYGREYPLYGGVENSLAIVELQKSNVVCTEMRSDTEYGDMLFNDGARWICGVSVPPESGQFIGMITAAYATNPSSATGFNKERFEGYFRFASKEITRY